MLLATISEPNNVPCIDFWLGTFSQKLIDTPSDTSFPSAPLRRLPFVTPRLAFPRSNYAQDANLPFPL